MSNIPNKPTTELEALQVEVNAELTRRRTIEEVPGQVDELTRSALTAHGAKEGDPWSQPTTVGYPTGWTVTHHDRDWANTIAGNTAEPGAHGWDPLG